MEQRLQGRPTRLRVIGHQPEHGRGFVGPMPPRSESLQNFEFRPVRSGFFDRGRPIFLGAILIAGLLRNLRLQREAQR